MVFVVKAGILAGAFYVNAAALFACGVAMAYLDRAGFPYTITLFGVVAGAAFLVPGWKYLRQSRRTASAPVRLPNEESAHRRGNSGGV
jgi:serine/threonine-protein kinase